MFLERVLALRHACRGHPGAAVQGHPGPPRDIPGAPGSVAVTDVWSWGPSQMLPCSLACWLWVPTGSTVVDAARQVNSVSPAPGLQGLALGIHQTYRASDLGICPGCSYGNLVPLED